MLLIFAALLIDTFALPVPRPLQFLETGLPRSAAVCRPEENIRERICLCGFSCRLVLDLLTFLI